MVVATHQIYCIITLANSIFCSDSSTYVHVPCSMRMFLIDPHIIIDVHVTLHEPK